MPTPESDEHLNKLRATGVCGTDLHLYESEWASCRTVVNKDSPVLVVGGGLIGSVAAHVLQLDGYEVTAVETVALRREKVRS